MTQGIARLARATVHAVMLTAALATALPAEASRWGARREFREGQREIARERREMRRDRLRPDSPTDARRASWDGQREIGRERREMRREVRRELRYGGWERDRVGEVIAGVALGAIIVTVARGVAPAPPSPELCWVWTDAYQERGYWDRCGGY